MKQLILATLAVAALASCQKENTIDSSLITNQQEMTFAPYAGLSTTRGTEVSNTNFAENGRTFEVAAYADEASYFGFSTVTHNGSAWNNTDKMYWPNADTNLHFGAYSPTDESITSATYSYAGTAHALSFGYTVDADVTDQVDLMYAISDYDYDYDYTDIADDTDSNKAELVFNHALTQVGFTATRDAALDVTVNSIKVCNVKSTGTFTATAKATSGWGDLSTPTNYTAKMASTGSIKVSEDNATTATQLTDEDDVMMLIPQELTPWDPDSDATDAGTSYLAIDCEIYHNGSTVAIIDGTIYVPFSTEDIKYASDDAATSDTWKAGYRVTYNLHFGGGYTGGSDPSAGNVPDPDDVIPTLRTVTYTISAVNWIDADTVPPTNL